MSDYEKQEFNYNEISGLGESDYENEDLFNMAVEENDLEPTVNNESTIMDESNFSTDFENQIDNNELLKDYSGLFYNNEDQNIKNEFVNDNLAVNNEENINEFTEPTIPTDIVDYKIENSDDSNFEEAYEDIGALLENYENNNIESTLDVNDTSDTKIEPKIDVNNISSTPMEELTKLTQYAQEKIETTDIKSLFDRVGVNVKEASDIFKKNTEMKEKIDARFEELKKLQLEVEKNKKCQYDEINTYKEDVLNKLTEKKEEIEKRLNKLKEFQMNLEQEKQDFEKYKKTQKEEIERVQKEIQDAYDSRREELIHIEDELRKQKDSLDEERTQLSLDIIQYEADKNELANNLLKFNEIVGAFTNGMDKIDKE